MSTTTIFDRDELLLVALAGCSLDEKPGSNWVQEAGGLPDYICRIARAIKKTGKSTSQAIAIAVSRVKKWAAGGDDVDADTRAKAAKALAQWEKLKAKSHTKQRKSGKTLAASTVDVPVLYLAASADYNVEIVRTAFEARQREVRKQYRDANPGSAYDDVPYLHVRELWTKHVIVTDGYSDGRKLYKVPYTVDAKQTVDFGDPVEVKTAYVAVTAEDLGDGGLSDADIKSMMDLTGPCPKRSATQTLIALGSRPGALERVLQASKND